MFDNTYLKAMRKRIAPYLQPGEELLSAIPVERAGMMKGYALGGELGVLVRGAARDHSAPGPDPGGVNLASANMTLAVTSRRLLIFKFGSGRGPRPEFLLTSVPVGDVDSIQLAEVRLASRPFTLTVRGTAYELEARRAINTGLMTAALEQAKSGGREAAVS